jgi:hypothetical protein
MPGEHLDLSSDGLSGDQPRDGTGQGGRPFVGMHFTCCDIYTRIYINAQQTSFIGHCPRCGRRVQIKVGPAGSDARFFTAS